MVFRHHGAAPLRRSPPLSGAGRLCDQRRRLRDEHGEPSQQVWTAGSTALLCYVRFRVQSHRGRRRRERRHGRRRGPDVVGSGEGGALAGFKQPPLPKRPALHHGTTRSHASTASTCLRTATSASSSTARAWRGPIMRLICGTDFLRHEIQSIEEV